MATPPASPPVSLLATLEAALQASPQAMLRAMPRTTPQTQPHQQFFLDWAARSVSDECFRFVDPQDKTRLMGRVLRNIVCTSPMDVHPCRLSLMGKWTKDHDPCTNVLTTNQIDQVHTWYRVKKEQVDAFAALHAVEIRDSIVGNFRELVDHTPFTEAMERKYLHLFCHDKLVPGIDPGYKEQILKRYHAQILKANPDVFACAVYGLLKHFYALDKAHGTEWLQVPYVSTLSGKGTVRR